MAHVGCFVPAESAVIGIVDKIFTRIHSNETAALDESNNQSAALRRNQFRLFHDRLETAVKNDSKPRDTLPTNSLRPAPHHRQVAVASG